MSAPPFHWANVGYGRGDDPAAVTENRRRVGSALGGRAADTSAWVSLHQVHGATVVAVDSPEPGAASIAADASVTTDPEAVLVILTADCGPVALVAPGVVGAVHAGWRGLAAGVVEAAAAAVAERSTGPVQAVLGPCVHPCCYEFSSVDLDPIADRLGAEVVSKTRAGRPALHVPRAVRAALRRAAVVDVTDVGVCTACSPDHFSHRRDGHTGLQAMLVALKKSTQWASPRERSPEPS